MALEAFSGHVETELAYLIAAHSLDEDSETSFTVDTLKELASSCCGPDHVCPEELSYLPSLLVHLPKNQRKHYCTRRITELLTVCASLDVPFVFEPAHRVFLLVLQSQAYFSQGGCAEGSSTR